MKVTILAAVFSTLIFCGAGFSQNTIRKEVNVGHAPLELVKPAIENELSAQGKFVLLPNKGTMMVIDEPANIANVERAIANLKVPNPNVGLNFAFKTGVAGGRMGKGQGRPVELYDFPFPTRFRPTQIIPTGNNRFVVIPAHPTNFTTRKIGTVLETQNTVNPDGSVNVDVNFQNTEFEGFINYGSGIFPSGTSGTVPVAGAVNNPQFFNPFVNSNKILVPIFSTTRISTQVVVRPTVTGGVVKVDMFPQLKIDNNETGKEPEIITLKKFRTSVDVKNNGIGKVNGFEGASGAFNRNFMGGKDEQEGTTAMIIKAQVFHGEVEEVKADEPHKKLSESEATNAKLEEGEKPETENGNSEDE